MSLPPYVKRFRELKNPVRCHYCDNKTIYRLHSFETDGREVFSLPFCIYCIQDYEMSGYPLEQNSPPVTESQQGANPECTECIKCAKCQQIPEESSEIQSD